MFFCKSIVCQNATIAPGFLRLEEGQDTALFSRHSVLSSVVTEEREPSARIAQKRKPKLRQRGDGPKHWLIQQADVKTIKMDT